MNKNSKNAFTLVELLAVIAVLGLVLIIAVPKITSVMENSKKKTLELTAKSIARSAEEKKTENETFDIEEEITCESISDYSSEDFSSCTIEFDDEGKAIVTLIGKGNYKGLNVCNATKMSATVQKEKCGSLVAHIKSLYNNETTRLANGLIKDNTKDENIRYSGSNEVVKNYVEFGNTNELWRIIGIFEVETENGKEELVKIVREDSIGNIAWDTSEGTFNSDTEECTGINCGFGINQWGESKYEDGTPYEGADLMQLLNGSYLNKQDAEGMCVTVTSQQVSQQKETCNFSSIGMSTEYKSMIERVVWNTGAWDFDFINEDIPTLDTVKLYNTERGTIGKKCSVTESDGNIYCNDEVERTATWEGLVALPYLTDYGYASSEEGCDTNMFTGIELSFQMPTSCKNNNWMHYGTAMFNVDELTWFLSPLNYTDMLEQGGAEVSLVSGSGMSFAAAASGPLRVRPTVYLRSDIKNLSGDGSVANAYKLSA